MRLQILGLNHNTAPVEIREQVVFAGDEVSRAVARIAKLEGIEEATGIDVSGRIIELLEKNAGPNKTRDRIKG